MRRYIIFLISLLSPLSTLHLAAQQPWTLEKCIDYALEHNITLKKSENQKVQKTIAVSTAKNARLPNLTGSAQENFSFGRGLTANNTYTNKNTGSTQLGLYTTVPIFTGMKLPNELKLAKLNLEAATADLDKAKNDIRLNVAQYFINAVYDRELLDIANRQIGIDSMQVHRMHEMLAVGKAAPSEVAQQEATLAQSRLTATNAANDLRLAILNLSQLLELTTPEGFNVSAPSVENVIVEFNDVLVSPEVIYAEALGIKPEIAAEELRLKGTQYSIKIAKSALYPTLNLTGGIGSNYYKVTGVSADGFFPQMKNNFNQTIGLSLSVPIFNRFATRNSIRSARIDQQNQQLTLDNAKKTLYKSIQQLYYNTLSAESTYKSSIAAAKSAQEAFDLMQAKYEAGKAIITEFNESKNNLLKAESNLSRAKYQYLYQRALTNFYRGKPLTL